MKTILLFILLTCLTGTAFAQDSGLFYDPSRDGEGLILNKRDHMIQFSFFTYIHRCNNKYFADEALIRDEDYNHCRRQQAWYITGQHPMANGEATGVLYTANPHKRHYGHDDEPIETLLADVVDIGLFVLTKTPTGYDMIVLQTGDVLHPESDIYHRTYTFDQYLFGAAPIPQPE